MANSTVQMDTPSVPPASRAGLGNDPQQLWDSIGPAYEDAFAGLTPQLKSLDWILSQLSSSAPAPDTGTNANTNLKASTNFRRAKCLDIGCGTGRPVCSTLAAAGHDVLGIDISPEMIGAARERVPEARFEVADLRVWRPPGNKEAGIGGDYDVITAYLSLICMSRSHIRGTIYNIHDWLKPGGLFVFATVPSPANEETITWLGREMVVSGFTVAEVRLLFEEEVGFEVLEFEESSFLPTAVEAGLVAREEDNWAEPHLFVYARKKMGDR